MEPFIRYVPVLLLLRVASAALGAKLWIVGEERPSGRSDGCKQCRCIAPPRFEAYHLGPGYLMCVRLGLWAPRTGGDPESADWVLPHGLRGGGLGGRSVLGGGTNG